MRELRLDQAADGHERWAAFAGEPDESGCLVSLPLALPLFRRACYYAALQRNDPLGEGAREIWPEGYNRVQPLGVSDWSELKRGGLFVLLELTEGGYLAVLPLVTPESIAWLSSAEGRLVLNAGHLGTARYQGDLELCVWARRDNLYAACEAAWSAATAAVGKTTRRRSEKHYPEMLRYLGWCSWEQYRFEIDEAVLVDALRAVKASGIPIRYALIDDGHIIHESRRLLKFGPDPVKFPNGWDPVLAERSVEQLAWFGLWLNFNGYWSGIAAGHDLGQVAEHLVEVRPGVLQPGEEFIDSFAWYDAFIGATRRSGFDFVKVDNQAQNVLFYRGRENGVRPPANNSQALEAACARHLDGLINCMAHNSVCAFNTRVSAVTRCSEDYLLNDPWRAKAHLHNSYGNLLWLGQTVWGDHDMFHSSDSFAGRLMALSKAVSGGPVCLSDDPRQFQPEHVTPLCFTDGRLLRPLAPAAPLPDSVFIDPFHEALPYKVIAPLPNRAAVVVAYNLTEPSRPVRGTLAAEDYRAAGGLLQDGEPCWDLPAEGLLWFDWRRREGGRLANSLEFRIDGFDDRHWLLLPVTAGWAVVGRVDKFLAPAGVEVLAATPAELLLRLPEGGPLWVWREAGEPHCGTAPLRDHGNGFWSLDLAIEAAARTVRLTLEPGA